MYRARCVQLHAADYMDLDVEVSKRRVGRVTVRLLGAACPPRNEGLIPNREKASMALQLAEAVLMQMPLPVDGFDPEWPLQVELEKDSKTASIRFYDTGTGSWLNYADVLVSRKLARRTKVVSG